MLKESAYVKIHTAVPVAAAARVRQAMGEAGAGEQGNYRHCSGSIPSTGRFVPVTGAEPAIGQVGQLTEVAEEIIAMLCHRDRLAGVIAALKQAHPYEEPAIDIIPRLELG
ncbi:MAG: hypothetical protein HYV42_00180 [Candidatus Magasanikbacteria bacterium]|nr:hypothetical protein [Candidatus Magasanikbacteria bacterium]